MLVCVCGCVCAAFFVFVGVSAHARRLWLRVRLRPPLSSRWSARWRLRLCLGRVSVSVPVSVRGCESCAGVCVGCQSSRDLLVVLSAAVSVSICVAASRSARCV